jgi:hypothetical protein
MLLSVCACLCILPIVSRQRLVKHPAIVARQRAGRNVSAVMNIHATVEELLDTSVTIWPVSNQRMQASGIQIGVREDILGVT